MKKILGLVTGLFLTVATIAQTGVTFDDAKDGYNKTTTTVFNFTFPSSYTVESINKVAAFYPTYFTVTPTTGEGVNVVIKLIEDNEMARRVITRFFIGMEIREISVNGTSMELQNFMEKYIML